MSGSRVRRHGLTARLAHGLNALAIVVLLVTGLALGDWFAPRAVALLGGHVAINGAHQYLGLAVVAALLLVACAWPRRTARLIAALRPLRRGDAGWLVSFARFWWRPTRYVAPFHDGRFDPAERVVLSLLIVALAVDGVSGVYLYVLPNWGRVAFVWAIRSHVIAAWVLLVLVGVHATVGLGVLATHRGITRAMFGDGTVSVSLARGLWPGWAARQAPVDDTAVRRDD